MYKRNRNPYLFKIPLLFCIIFTIYYIMTLNPTNLSSEYYSDLDPRLQTKSQPLKYSLTNVKLISRYCGGNSTEGIYWMGTGEQSIPCLKWLAKNIKYDKLYPSRKLRFHTFINQIDRNNLDPPFYATLLSYLLSQNEDSTLWIWVQKIEDREHIVQNPGNNFTMTYKMPKSSRIEFMIPNEDNLFRFLNHSEEMKDIFLDKSQTTADRNSEVYFSDLARLAILKVYGGIYVDFDTFLLRSMEPLIHHQFSYRWGSGSMSNNAILYFKRDGVFINKMLEYAWVEEESKFDPMRVGPGSFEIILRDHFITPTSKISEGINATEVFIIYPAVYFDAHWMVFDDKLPEGQTFEPNLPGVFDAILHSEHTCTFPKSQIFSKFFHGAFAYHCHCLKPYLPDFLMTNGSCLHGFIVAMQSRIHTN